MCCEDVKIDYGKYGIGKVVTLGVASGEILGPDPYRWSILIGQVASGTAWIIPEGPAVLGNGFEMATVQAPLMLTREMVGDLIGRPWFAIHSVGGINIYVVESLITLDGVCGDYYKQRSGDVFVPTGAGNFRR